MLHRKERGGLAADERALPAKQPGFEPRAPPSLDRGRVLLWKPLNAPGLFTVPEAKNRVRETYRKGRGKKSALQTRVNGKMEASKEGGKKSGKKNHNNNNNK